MRPIGPKVTSAKGKPRGKAEGKAVGRAEGKAEALVAFLAARGLALSEDLREKILGCKDPAMLDRWIAQAASASAEEALR
jgi:hypothetical protein